MKKSLTTVLILLGDRSLSSSCSNNKRTSINTSNNKRGGLCIYYRESPVV